MANVPNDPKLARFPIPRNGRGIHFPIDPRMPNVIHFAPFITQLRLSCVTVFGQDENDSVNASAYIYKQTGAIPIIRAQASPPHNPGHKYPDFYGKQTQLAIASGIPTPLIQIGNEPTTEGWSVSDYGAWWQASAEIVVAAGGLPGIQVTGEEEFQVLAGMSDAVKANVWFAHHGQPANHPPAYPYDARNQQDHPGATAITDNSCFLSALQVPYWSQKYLGGITIPVYTTEGPWQMQSPGDTGQDNRYPAVTPDLWFEYMSVAYDMFRTGILPNGDPLPDWWLSFNYWLLYDGGGFMASGLLGSWHPEWKLSLVNKLELDSDFTRVFSGATPPSPTPPPPVPPPAPPPPPVPPTPAPPPVTGNVEFTVCGVGSNLNPAKFLTPAQGQMYEVTQVVAFDNVPSDDPASENNINIYVVVQDKNGKNLNGEAVTQVWPSGSSTHYTRNGMTAHQQSGDSNFDPNKGESGPYIMRVGDASVSGLGLPLRQHVEYLILITKQQ